MFDLTGKIALVTGGASGIGLAISQLLAKQGAFVHILELNVATAHQVAAQLVADGHLAQAHAVDVSNQASVVATIDSIAAKSAIHILVNNAGVAHVGRLDTTSETDFDRVYNINVKGYYNCMYAAIPHLKAAGAGVILNLASIAATVGLADRFAYSMSKGAVLSMTLSVAKDYVKDHIRCVCISPARVHTPFVDGFIAKNYPGQERETFERLSKTQPIGRMADPAEIAALALFLCSDEASFITGVDYAIDGGFTRLNT